MKLISCYIENFGNIKQSSFDFARGLTSFCEHNGYGKTTLAAFMKAMFYGLKQTTARDKELGERARFYPFEGGKFGGNVVFEKDGVTYKIERFFGRKSATEDTLAVYGDNELLPEPDDIGKEFFGLDEQSFMRTVFVNSGDTESGATGDISRMLNGFVDDADFDGAKKILEKHQKEYKAGRGRGGKIDEKRDEIIRLKENIENKEKINGELSRKYGERKELADAVAELEIRQSSSRDVNLVLQKWKTLDGFSADAEAERIKLNATEQRYPAGIPEADEIQTLKRNAEALNLANERQISAVFPVEKERRLEELSARFSEGTPTDEEIASATRTAADIIRLEAEISNCESLIKGGADSRFAAGVPDGEEVEKYGEKLKALREKSQQPPAKKGGKLPVVFALFALILLGAGVGLMFMNIIVGCVVLALGAICVLAAIFMYFKVQINWMKEVSDEGSELENEIKSFLARCGYYSGGGVEVDYNNLVRDLETYRLSVEENEKYTRLLEEKKETAGAKKESVKAFLGRYGLSSENAQSELARLGALTAEYTALKTEKDDCGARFSAVKAEAEERTRTINGILSKYSIDARENLSALAAEIERDRMEYDRLKENTERLEKRASDFREENGLYERPSYGAEDTAGIDAELYRKRDELSLLDREISDDESAVERLAELREELESAQEEELILKKKYELLVKTLSLLERAEGNLKDRYISPVKNSFLSYSKLLEKALGEKVVFDKDFKVRFERGGEDRSDAHLSAGQKSLCALCLRLALIDNMYKDGQPFIIMDDPFVHLDDEHMQRARQLVGELARGKQIIYFCCHESRKI